MQPEQVLSSDLLDIVFADRNKSYGAYPLRKEYNKRLSKSLFITGAIIGFVLIAYYFSNGSNNGPTVFFASTPIELVDVTPPEEPAPPLAPPPPPPPPPPQQVAMVKNNVPVIVPDEKADAPPPTIDDLDRSLIGPINQDGVDAPDVVAPPVEEGGKGITAAPKPLGDDNGEFVPIEVESTYPGGMAAWTRFLIRTLNYPNAAQNNGVEGRITVKFVVDKDGVVSHIEAVSGPEELRAEAIRVIGKSGKWTPALQNGNHVKSYKYQQIIFELEND